MQPVTKLNVIYHDREVGILAKSIEGLYPFEYSDSWLTEGFALNPLTLPLEKGVFMPKANPLDGMFGVFNDSLPDGWGRLLVDRMIVAQGKTLDSFDALTRLAIVGHSGMGALRYEPVYPLKKTDAKSSDLDHLAKECSNLFAEKPLDDLDALFSLGGSSGGARPKILTKIDGEDWIVKFRSSQDPSNIGEQEYQYAKCASLCGIAMPETRLFPSKVCAGYFGTKRFDRGTQGESVHMVSVSGLLETSHRLPNLDYKTLMKLTQRLTADMSDLKELFRRMCFNVFAHNRDDHSKNFSFLYNEEAQTWHLSPAYDLTFSASVQGEHATSIAGNGKNPGESDLLDVAEYAGLSPRWAQTTAAEIAEQTRDLITKYQV